MLTNKEKFDALSEAMRSVRQGSTTQMRLAEMLDELEDDMREGPPVRGTNAMSAANRNRGQRWCARHNWAEYTD